MRLRKTKVRPAGRAFAGRRLAVALAAAGLVGLSLTSGAVAASPANATTYYTLYNPSTTLCLTSGGDTDTPATEYSCNGSENQEWYWGSEEGTSGFSEFKNRTTGQCLGVLGGSTAAGAEVVVWSCQSGAENQYWNAETGYFVASPDWLVFFNYNGASSGSSSRVMEVKCDCDEESGKIDQEPLDVLGSPYQAWSYGG
jgi:phosphoribosyl-AMP cyclohydrolase